MNKLESRIEKLEMQDEKSSDAVPAIVITFPDGTCEVRGKMYASREEASAANPSAFCSIPDNGRDEELTALHARFVESQMETMGR